MKEEVINVEILADGTVKSTTPKISAANHQSANEFFSHLTRLTLGERTASKRNKALEGQVQTGTQQKAGH